MTQREQLAHSLSEEEALYSSHKNKQVRPLSAFAKKPNMCSRLFNCFRQRSSRVSPFVHDVNDVHSFGIDDIDVNELRKRSMASYSTQVLPEYPTAENYQDDQQHYIVVDPEVVEEASAEPVVVDPVIITPNPNSQASKLEDIVYYGQWHIFWALFLKDAIDSSMHPTPLKDSFPALFAAVQPGQKEMKVTLQLVELMVNPRDTMHLNDVQEWLALINPAFDWDHQVARPLQYKRLLLTDTHLPEDVQAMIWKDHVQPDLVHQAIRRCVQDVLVALDEELSQHAATSRN